MDSRSSTSQEAVNDFTTKLVYFSNEFPGDDLKDLFRRLQRHSKDKRFRVLASFLEECTEVIKKESQKLPRPLQDLLPPFQTALSLADDLQSRRGPLGAALESALLCILQIGMFIGYHEGEDFEYDFVRSNTTLAGLSIGLLAAAAVSVSGSLSEVATTGAESVRVAFRLGIHVANFSESLEAHGADGNLESWAYVVTGLCEEDVQRELDLYNAETSHPELTKIFISAADKNSVSVSGPPSRLKAAFRHSQILRYSKHLPMPVYNGLCHAPHVYGTDDVHTIAGVSDPLYNRSRHVKVPLLSPNTGEPFLATTAGELFEQIAAEILIAPIRLDNLTNGICSSISSSGKPVCNVCLFHSSLISNGFLSAIDSTLPHVTILKNDYLAWSTIEPETRLPRSPKQAQLAVVGMSCRMPGGANDTERFWELMVEGRDVHTRVPADRFELDTHFDPTGQTPNATETPFGNFIDAPGMFDAGFFNMSPREAEQTDPMHRLALVTAYEALEMAGYAPQRTPSTNLKRIGTFFGQASDDWRELNGGQNIGTYAVPAGERAFANGRINYFFKFGGPSFNIDTACSSGLAAVNAACAALWAGDADMVIAGGLSVITNPDNYCMLCKGYFLSKTGQCKVWDKEADGYCRADGVGSVVIKRLEDAEADNDNIIAVVLAGATNHSADAISITHPHAGAQKENYRQVLHAAGINPLDVSYVELHGTGTQAGDAVESESVADVFAPLIPRRPTDQPLHLGAVKGNIGHAEAAAGIASFIKALLVYQKNVIPRQVGFKTELNPIIAQLVAKRNVGLAMENVLWHKIPGKQRYSVVNSFGAHGGNTTMLLADAPEMPRIGKDPRSTYPVTISAKSKASLAGNIEALLSYLDQNPDTEVGDLSYTTCARRIHHNTRIATAVSSLSQLRSFLKSCLEASGNYRSISIANPKVVFTFTGQGSFYNGIGSQLFKHFPFFREQVLQLDRLVQQSGFPSVIPGIEGAVGDGASPLVTQLIIVVIEIALVRFWALLGIHPSVVIGHSLGEYAALVAAGVLSAADAIFLVGRRAELILAACEIGGHAMLAVRASVETIEKICVNDNSFEISCINGKEDTVISGNRSIIQSTRTILENNGIKCSLLDVPFAFHTAQMDPILDSFEQIAKNVAFKTPCVPVMSPLLSNCVFDGKTINAKYLRRASREPVNFVGALAAGQDLCIIDDKTIWLDIGPHPICVAFVRSYIPNSKVLSSLRRNEDNFASITSSLANFHCEGFQVRWNEYFKPHEKAHKLLTLPSYKWNEKNYWIQYVGTWTLDKAHAKDHANKRGQLGTLNSCSSSLRSSSIHQIVSEDLTSSTGKLVAVSDIMHPDLFAAVNGHMMNGSGVATTSIWADMALTVGEHLYKSLLPKSKEVHMNVTDMEVLHAQVAQNDKSSAQLLMLEADIDLTLHRMEIRWYNLSIDGTRSTDAFASSTVRFEEPTNWQFEWERVEHLVNGRIDALTRMAADGTANKLSKNMVYNLFKNVVDYTEKYRGMTSVVLHEHEAFAEISLAPEMHGTWHTPPHWIDSVFHLAGFIMNGSDASNTKDFFYVTPGWSSSRLIKPLKAGVIYRSYVRMFPTKEANMTAGDVYILQDDVIVGMMGQIKFRRVPRLLMNQFFSPPDSKKTSTGESGTIKLQTLPQPAVAATSNTLAVTPVKVASTQQPNTHAQTANASAQEQRPLQSTQAATSAVTITQGDSKPNSVIDDCLRLIAREAGLELDQLVDDASFVELGVDSLMSLVLSEKFRTELQLEVKSSLFLEYTRIGELKGWLEQYC